MEHVAPTPPRFFCLCRHQHCRIPGSAASCLFCNGWEDVERPCHGRGCVQHHVSARETPAGRWQQDGTMIVGHLSSLHDRLPASVTWGCDVREEAPRDTHRTQHERDARTAWCAKCKLLPWACCATLWRRCLEWNGAHDASRYGAQSGRARISLSLAFASGSQKTQREAVVGAEGQTETVGSK